MVNLHVFSFNSQINSFRAKVCLSETLKYQTNYKLFIWSEDCPEIADIINKSPFCQKVLSMENPYYASIYDYVKMHIMKKYGGWFFELDQIIEDNLSIVDIQKNKSFLNSTPSGTFTATTWNPIYVDTNIDILPAIQHADESLSSYIELNETYICEIKSNENVEGIIPLNFSHIDTGSFNKPSLYGYDRIYFEENNSLWAYYPKTKWKRKYYTFEVFEAISRSFNFFDKELNILCQNGEVSFSRSVFDKASKLYKLPKEIKVVDSVNL